MSQTTVIGDDKTSRLMQMRAAQKRLKDKRKTEQNMLSSELETLKAQNDLLAKENKRLQRHINSIFGLLNNGVTSGQLKSLASVTDYKFEDEDEAYIPLHELLELNGYNRFKNLFDGENNFVLKTLCFKSIHLHNRAFANYEPSKFFTFMYKQMPKYGLSLVGNFFRDIQKVYHENLVPKCWFYPRDQMDIPSYTLSTPEIIQEIIDKFDPDSMNLEVLISFLGRESFVTDYGLAVRREDLENCFEISSISKFGEAYTLDCSNADACLAAVLKNMKQSTAATGYLLDSQKKV
ncbi:hypothetical protein CLIB1444_15S01376 [[Candida] jaroonii]|uniref:Uncharacterized protein n=1 Tax=[Candida] jaroonii TaxID=467808 RepID=A0ACA9YFL5_9ASCO|nr:hypothetical protein CLIB1444_15S01376 [[Candida] jaroonii]